MNDQACVRFLQWALPRLRMRWTGFRKVRGQVCKRISRRIKELGLADLVTYEAYLKQYPQEWSILEGMCRVTISRFFRDRAFFGALESSVLPALARSVADSGGGRLRCWSAGCASGEEAYSLSLLWHYRMASDWPGMTMEIIGTDVDTRLLHRATRGCYTPSSVKEVSLGWLSRAFTWTGEEYCLTASFRDRVRFLHQDIRARRPPGSFHLILCRNLVFTYFDEGLQREILAAMADILADGGALAVGTHESIPPGVSGLTRWDPRLPIYRKRVVSSESAGQASCQDPFSR